MALFDGNIFDPNIFGGATSTSTTESSVVERKKSKGRTGAFFGFDTRKFRKLFQSFESSKSVELRAFAPAAIKATWMIESVRLQDLDAEKLIEDAKAQLLSAASKSVDMKTLKKTMAVTSFKPKRVRLTGTNKELLTAARELIESAKELTGIKDLPISEDGFCDILTNEMMAESFRQDIIPISIDTARDEAVKSAWLGNFSGLNRDQSQYLRDILQDAFSNNASHSATIARLQRFVGIPYEQAKTIVDTEFQQLRNRARMLAYQDDETKDSRYIWDTQRDKRVCKICEAIKRNTLPGGVTMSELLDIIREAQYHFGADTARRYIAHVGDRCRIARLK